jgi:DNA-binding NtrC family response regulator
MCDVLRSVLVVEGDAAMREMLVAQLGEEGIRVRPAASAAEARAALADREISAVLAELDLVEQGAVPLLPELRSLGREIPVVLMSAFGWGEAERLAREAGAFACLAKPFAPEQLLGVLRRAWGARPETLGE